MSQRADLRDRDKLWLCSHQHRTQHKTAKPKTSVCLRTPRALALIFISSFSFRYKREEKIPHRFFCCCFFCWTWKVKSPLFELPKESQTSSFVSDCGSCLSSLSRQKKPKKLKKKKKKQEKKTREGDNTWVVPPALLGKKALLLFYPNNEDWDDIKRVSDSTRCGLSPLQLPQPDLDLHKVSATRRLGCSEVMGEMFHLLLEGSVIEMQFIFS